MGNVMLSPQIVMISTLMLVAIVVDCYFLVPVTIRSGKSGERGYCFGGMILFLTLIMFAGVFGYFAGVTIEDIVKVLKLPLVLLIYWYGGLTWLLANKSMKNGHKKYAYTCRVISILAVLGALILYVRILTA